MPFQAAVTTEERGCCRRRKAPDDRNAHGHQVLNAQCDLRQRFDRPLSGGHAESPLTGPIKHGPQARPSKAEGQTGFCEQKSRLRRDLQKSDMRPNETSIVEEVIASTPIEGIRPAVERSYGIAAKGVGTCVTAGGSGAGMPENRGARLRK